VIDSGTGVAVPATPRLALRPDGIHLSAPRRFLSPPGVAGLALLALVAGSAAGAPWLAPYNPTDLAGRPFEAPSAAHWLGTNDVGHDILSEALWGGRVSLVVGVLAAAAGVAVGLLAGALAGYFRGGAEALVMRTADVALVLPFLPLMIVLAVYVGPSAGTLVAVIAVLAWARPARVLRSVALGERARDYVVAAHALGAGDSRILRVHVLPALVPVALAEFVLLASRAILLEASLAFLGLGDPVRKSWGAMLYYAQARGAFLSGAWVWWTLPPGLLITATVLAFALIAFDLERRANPRLATRLRW
jgi:peptide/nickel transport system ATP-binding protein/peptide/nickel transport system permease protein